MVKRELEGSILGLHIWGWLCFWTTQLNQEKQKWIEQQKSLWVGVILIATTTSVKEPI